MLVYASYVSSSYLVQDGRIERLARGQWVTTTCDSMSLYTLETKKPATSSGGAGLYYNSPLLDLTHLLIARTRGGTCVVRMRIAPDESDS